MKYFNILFSIIASLLLGACSENDNFHEQDEVVEPPMPEVNPVVKAKKVYVWIDAQANLDKFTTVASIESYMKQIKEAGIDGIYLNVKPGIGYALYNSDTLKKLTKWGNNTYIFNFDYLGEFIKIGNKFNLDVYAAVDAVGYGIIRYKQGPVYEDDSFDGVTQVRMLNHDPSKLEDMRDRSDAVSANLSLIHPKTQSLLLTVCSELASKYPDLTGICLDVLRFEDLTYCMSDYSMKTFADYIGESSVNRNDLITSAGGQGKYFNKWIEFRTRTVTEMVNRVRQTVKSINPDLQLHLWSAGQWSSRFEVGQNWSSVNYTLPSGPYTKDYQSLGFAHLIDAIVPGAYTSKVWESDGPWSVEGHIKTYNDIVRGDTKIINSIAVYSYTDPKAMQDAMYLSLRDTDGLMLFDLCHICEQNFWPAVKEAIQKYNK